MKRIVIIGAGPAGLTAAYELLKKTNDYEVVILESSNSIGGISKTVIHNGNRMDIGGHRFFSKDKRVLEWWKSIMPLQGNLSYDDKTLKRNAKVFNGGPDPEYEDSVMLLRNRISRIYYKNSFFDYPITLKLKTFINMGLLSTIKAGFSYLYSCVHKLPENSLENFYINRFGKVLYRMFFEGYTEKLWGIHPSKISADWGAQRVKGLSIKAVIKDILQKIIPFKNKKTETSLIEEFWYPKYGPGHLWEAVAKEIELLGGKIIFNANAEEILINNNSISGIKYKIGDKILEKNADIIISSMPLKDLSNSIKEIPENIKNISDNLPYRDFITIGILIDKLKLVNKTNIKTFSNVVPDCWIYVQDTGVKLGRIQIFNNWSPYMVKEVENKVWIGLEYFCNENDDFWNMNDSDRINLAVDELIKIGVLDNNELILDSCCHKVKKAYPAYFGSYKDIDKVIEYVDSIKGLYCIGRNGQHRYNNMDHSMITAFEAVKNILNNSTDNSNIWNVNTEQEFHEENNKGDK